MFRRLKCIIPIIQTFQFSIPIIQASTLVKEEPSFSQLDLIKDLQHESLIKQACTVNINASSQLITVTSLAVQETCTQIRECLSKEMALVEQIMEYGEVLAPEEFCDELIAIRNKLNKLNCNLTTLSGYLEYAEKVATAVAEISYISGNIAGSDVMCERINQAIRACEQERELLKTLKSESIAIQKTAIEKSIKLKEIFSDIDSEKQ